MSAVVADFILVGDFADLPTDNASGTAGRLYFALDTGQVLRDNGATWDDATAFILAALAGKQASDADLAALAALASTGILARTAANTYALRALAAGDGVAITDGDGVSGDPTVALDVPALTADASPDAAADYVLTYDTSASAHKKVLIEDLPSSGGGSLPTGGTTGQVLTKQSSTDGDADWEDPTGGGGGSLAAQEADGTPTDSAVTGLILPNGLVSIASHVLTLLSQNDAAITPPDSSAFSWVNQGDATLVTSPFGMGIEAPANAGSNLRMRSKSLPSAPYTITCRVRGAISEQNYGNYGIGLRESSSGKVVNLVWTNGRTILAQQHSGPTAGFVANYAVLTMVSLPEWFQIQDDNTNRIYRISGDGVSWFTVWTVGRTDYCTPDQFVFICAPPLADAMAAATLLSYKES